MKKIDISRGDFEKQGPGIKENSVSVTAAADITRPFSLELYSEPDGKRVSSIHFPKEYRMGSVYSIELKGLDPDSCLYRLKSGRKEYTDPYVRNIKGNRKFGKRDGLGRFDTPAPSIKNKRPLTEWEDMIAYLLNVRAFTKDSSSGTAHPGTFDALREKIPYLKDLGVTSLMLQPAYDFDEVTDLDHMSRLNLWGYVPGNYFVPKPS